MNLASTVKIYGGGPGSGCTGPNCGRPEGSGEMKDSPKLQKMKLAEDQFKKEIEGQGYDSKNVTVVYNSPPYDGIQSIADTFRKTGIIEFHPDVFVDKGAGMTLKGIAAHEVMHVKFNKFIPSHDMEKENLFELAEDDGVSGYSREIWNHFYKQEKNISVGVTETLAEMARIKAETGKLPGTFLWKDLYKRVLNFYGKNN